MKHFKIFLTFFFMFLFVASCNKDKLISTETRKLGTSPTFKSFNWSASEQKFFSKKPRRLQAAHSRNGTETGLIYHPLLIKAYNKLAEQNESHSFVDGMVNKTGVPLWSESYIYQNPVSNENLVLIPLAFESQNNLSGFISLTQKGPAADNNFIINGVSRQMLLDTSSGNPWQKSGYQKWMLTYDEKLFGTSEQKLKDAYCISKSKLNDVAPPTEGGLGNPSNRGPMGCKGDTLGGNCQWNTVEVCWHNGDQVHWFGGIKNIPPHLDHDHDGVINSEDEDFPQLGLTQEEFEEHVRRWWEEEHKDEFGEYDDNWDIDDPDWGANIDFDALAQIWDSFGDFLRDLVDDIGDIINDIQDWWDDLIHDDHCWGGRPANGVENRTEVVCEWFYLQDCGQGPGQDISWWDDFAAVVPCPECTGYQEYQDMLRDRLYAHWEEHYYALGSAIDFWDFYNRNLEWNCDPYSPCFEECVDENFVNDYFNLPPIPITPISFPQALDDCFISITACPNCFYTATLYIEQPVPGTREIFDWTGNGSSGSGKNSGHTFMSLKQYDPAVSLIEPIRTLTFGFYPAYKPEGQNTVPGSFYEENEATVFNVSVLYSLTLSQYEDIKTSLSNIENIYQIEYSNCSTLPAIVLNHAGFNIPMTERHVWRLGDIKANPADLGEDLRANHAPGTIITSDTYLNPPLSKCN